MCQKIGCDGNCPMVALLVIQHPASPVRSLTGLQTGTNAFSQAESVTRANAMPIERRCGRRCHGKLPMA